MAINFPSSPSNNQLFVAEGKAMRYVASKGKWKQVSTLTSTQITDLEARTVGVSSMSISGNTLVIQKDDSSYANVSLASFAGNKLTTYANASILPLSDLVSGTQVYVEDTDSLYITDGSGWYKIATVNLSPSLTLGVESISLTSGGSVDVNYTVNEPEDTPYTVTASSTSNATITVHQANNTITFDTPVAATTETITITATDGVNSVGDTLTMTITLGTPIVFPNQSGTKITITNGNDNSWTMTNSGSTQTGGNVFSDDLDQGKKYIEVRLDAMSNTATFMLGLAPSSLSSSGWSSSGQHLFFGGNGNIYPGYLASGLGGMSINDIIQIAYDTNTGEIWFNKNNGSWYPNSPSSNSSITVASGSVKLSLGEANSTANRTHSFTALTAANMVYSPPSGFTAH